MSEAVMKKYDVAIVGAGLAGFTVAHELRERGFAGGIQILGDEGLLPYDRPPLSKECLTKGKPGQELALRPESYYVDRRVDVVRDSKVTSIDREARTVHHAAGSTCYDALVLATGAVANNLPQALSRGLSGIHTLRSAADAAQINKEFETTKSVLIVGGGYIGLEIAAAGCTRGLKVSLLEAAPRILQRVTGSATSAYFRELHCGRKIDIREEVQLESLVGDQRVVGARLSDGSEISADLVVVGIGVKPRVALAEAAGLKVGNGILTDNTCRTSDPAIWAAGDCASFVLGDRIVRLESVGNAIDMARCVAANIMGDSQIFRPLPWFWSDQFDTKLQIAGLAYGHDHMVVRNGARDGSKSHWYYSDNTLLAVEAINDPRAYMVGKRLIELGLSPASSIVADSNQNLKALLTQ